MLGQAGGRTAVTPEKVAINIMDARIKDNEGNKPCDEPVVEGGPTAYFSTLPVREITEKLRKTEFPLLFPTQRGLLYATAFSTRLCITYLKMI